jgi:hypothetical protein
MEAMTTRATLLLLAGTAVLLCGCAAPSARDPPASGENAKPADAHQVLEKKFQEAARGYKLIEKNGQMLYCKRETLIGSTIPTTQCMTEERLRLQVEYDQQMRDRMRTGARCAVGHRGGAGGCAGS